MNTKLKIKVSEAAFSQLQSMIALNPEYTHIRLSYINGCCRSSKIEITLDAPKENDIIDNIENLNFLYNADVLKNIKEVILVYRNSHFLIKTVSLSHNCRNCSKCEFSCNHNKGCCKPY